MMNKEPNGEHEAISPWAASMRALNASNGSYEDYLRLMKIEEQKVIDQLCDLILWEGELQA